MIDVVLVVAFAVACHLLPADLVVDLVGTNLAAHHMFVAVLVVATIAAACYLLLAGLVEVLVVVGPVSFDL